MVADDFSGRADEMVARDRARPVVSDFAAAESAPVIARTVRMRLYTETAARALFARFDLWQVANALAAETNTADMRVATDFLRRLDPPLRAPDAIHSAIARRLGASLATFDVKMAASARLVRVDVAAG